MQNTAIKLMAKTTNQHKNNSYQHKPVCSEQTLTTLTKNNKLNKLTKFSTRHDGKWLKTYTELWNKYPICSIFCPKSTLKFTHSTFSHVKTITKDLVWWCCEVQCHHDSLHSYNTITIIMKIHLTWLSRKSCSCKFKPWISLRLNTVGISRIT